MPSKSAAAVLATSAAAVLMEERAGMPLEAAGDSEEAAEAALEIPTASRLKCRCPSSGHRSRPRRRRGRHPCWWLLQGHFVGDQVQLEVGIDDQRHPRFGSPQRLRIAPAASSEAAPVAAVSLFAGTTRLLEPRAYGISLSHWGTRALISESLEGSNISCRQRHYGSCNHDTAVLIISLTSCTAFIACLPSVGSSHGPPPPSSAGGAASPSAVRLSLAGARAPGRGPMGEGGANTALDSTGEAAGLFFPRTGQFNLPLTPSSSPGNKAQGAEESPHFLFRNVSEAISCTAVSIEDGEQPGVAAATLDLLLAPVLLGVHLAQPILLAFDGDVLVGHDRAVRR